jgi:mycoredoxin
VTIPHAPTPDRPTVFTTTWCGYCRRLKAQLDRAGIAYAEVDIDRHEDGALLVAQANDGNLTVPTVLFADGAALTNPPVSEISRKLSTAA